MQKLPTIIATSVVRGSQQGESHGGIYLVDFQKQEANLVVDWDDSGIDFTGRGWDRGLRGIEFRGDEIYIAASDEIFVYDPNFQHNYIRTPLGGFINHSENPNCELIEEDGDYHYKKLKTIKNFLSTYPYITNTFKISIILFINN